MCFKDEELIKYFFSLLDTEVLPGGASREEMWRPIIGVPTLITGIVSVLDKPNTVSPANVSASDLYLRCIHLYMLMLNTYVYSLGWAGVMCGEG